MWMDMRYEFRICFGCIAWPTVLVCIVVNTNAFANHLFIFKLIFFFYIFHEYYYYAMHMWMVYTIRISSIGWIMKRMISYVLCCRHWWHWKLVASYFVCWWTAMMMCCATLTLYVHCVVVCHHEMRTYVMHMRAGMATTIPQNMHGDDFATNECVTAMIESDATHTYIYACMAAMIADIVIVNWYKWQRHANASDTDTSVFAVYGIRPMMYMMLMHTRNTIDCCAHQNE